jgi:hypothetical protein
VDELPVEVGWVEADGFVGRVVELKILEWYVARMMAS